MKEITNSVEEKVDELLTVLDKDIQHIQQSLARLDELRSLVVKRDDVALGKLLEHIRNQSDSYQSHELNRQSIREEIATALGCDIKQATLSTLEGKLSKVKREQVARKKTELISLINKLKREHLSTTLFLSECARINRMLLKDVFKLGNTGTVYYGSKGATKRESDMAFVNLQL